MVWNVKGQTEIFFFFCNQTLKQILSFEFLALSLMGWTKSSLHEAHGILYHRLLSYLHYGIVFHLDPDLKLFTQWNILCLEVWETSLHLKKCSPLFCSCRWNVAPQLFGKLQCPSIEVCHIYFKGCSLSFMTSVFTVLSAISLDKVPPLSILTFKNLSKHLLGLFKFLCFKYDLCLISYTYVSNVK